VVVMRVDGDTRPLVMLRLDQFVHMMRDRIVGGADGDA
jgi:hypothetical protein